MYYIILSALGLAVMLILMYKMPALSGEPKSTEQKQNSVSVVIPVRNEGHNIANLLGDLLKQSYKPLEIICVDDGSTDDSRKVIASFNGVRLLTASPMKCVNTKAVACQTGADVATGDLLLFLDADVRLSPWAIKKLIFTQQKTRVTLSVQPFHSIVKPYERCSYFFNLVQLAANGCCSAMRCKVAGLYGPVILIENKLYSSIGGHRCAVDSIVDDMELARQLDRLGHAYDVRLGHEDISFRMYPGGMEALVQGWVKNMATGASYTSPVMFLLTFIWLTGAAASTIAMFYAIGVLNIIALIASIISYSGWVYTLYLTAKRVGNFSLITALSYPVWLVAFFSIFAISAVKKLLKWSVDWKGRKIRY